MNGVLNGRLHRVPYIDPFEIFVYNIPLSTPNMLNSKCPRASSDHAV